MNARYTGTLMGCGVLIVVCLARGDEPAREALALSQAKGGVCAWLAPAGTDGLAGIADAGEFLVHGIVPDGEAAAAGRKAAASRGLGGVVSVEALPLERLPYGDNMVNLLVTEDLPGAVARGLALKEVARVLAPGGTACMALAPEKRKDMEKLAAEAELKGARFEPRSKLWLVFVKPRPDGMDEWTHWRHGPDANPVSHDLLLDRPNRLQWIAGPHWENHRGVWTPGCGSSQGLRTAGGRCYYIMGSQLLARDAFNGVQLWHDVIKGLDTRFVIASGNELYLLRAGEVVALDGATGKTLRTYGKAGQCANLLLSGGLLLCFEGKSVRAFDAAGGQEKWATADAGDGGSALAADGRIYLSNGAELVGLELATGKVLWKRPSPGNMVFAFSDKLLVSTKTSYAAVNGGNGSEAWSYELAKPEGAYFAGGRVWVRYPDDRAARKTKGFHNRQGGVAFRWVGLDPATGKETRRLDAPVTLEFMCHPLFATDRFLVANRPIYFTSWEDGTVKRFEATRMACGSTCVFGNGLFYGLYTNSRQCMCIRNAISGVSAYGCDGQTIDGAVPVDENGRLNRGEAAAPEAGDWPTPWPMYRSDRRRSACTSASPATNLVAAWKQALLPAAEPGPPRPLRNDWRLNVVSADPIAQPTVGGGKVFVSLTHAGQVVALDEATGAIAWRFQAPGRLDTSPALHMGLCLLGCHDGRVYGLRADTGALVWSFRAAPAERRIVAYGQLESPWPVVGGVLLGDGIAYAVAGRTTEVDGGLYVHALEPATGRLLWSGRRVKPDDGAIGAWNLRGLSWNQEGIASTYFGPSDLLVSDGKSVAIGGHNFGHFDCASGGAVSPGTFDGPHFGWMQSRYASDNQKLDYPPRAVCGSQVAYAGKNMVGVTGKPGWRYSLPGGGIVEALAAGGNPEAEGWTAPPPPFARIRCVAKPPVVDGVLDPMYGESATPLTFAFLDGAPGRPREATTAWAVTDRENLYVAFRCEKKDPDKLVCRKTKRDDEVWQDECVELFLDTRDSREKNYLHLIVNPAGITQESRGGDMAWNPEVQTACGKEAGKAWIAEVRIPFKDLDVKTGGGGQVWSLNLNRSARRVEAPGDCEDTAWAPTYTDSSHMPDRFGRFWIDALQGDSGESGFPAWKKAIGHARDGEAKDKTTPAAVRKVFAATYSRGGDPAAGGGVLLFSADGAPLASADLTVAPAFEGLAFGNGSVFVTTQDGAVLCFREK